MVSTTYSRTSDTNRPEQKAKAKVKAGGGCGFPGAWVSGLGPLGGMAWTFPACLSAFPDLSGAESVAARNPRMCVSASKNAILYTVETQ